MKLLSKLVTDRTVSVLLAGIPPMQANDTHPNFQRILDALAAQNYEALPDLFSVANAVRKYAAGLDVRGGAVFLDGEALAGPIVQRIIDNANNGRSNEWLANFQRSLKLNPSRRIREQLYAFIEKSTNIGINDAGNIVAYKVVRQWGTIAPGADAPTEFVSIHDRTTRHDLGQVVSMPRHDVDDDPTRTCSYGLHACSEGYLANFGGGSDDWVVAVEIKPENVVSIPTNYDFAKMRCCEYKVIAVLGPQVDIVKSPPNLDDYDYGDDDLIYDDGDYNDDVDDGYSR